MLGIVINVYIVIEKGVFDALNKEYLSSLTFTIFSKHPINQQDLPLESYEFKVAYADENQPARINGVNLATKDQLKSQASKFVRSLVEFSSTLEELPHDRWITLTISVGSITTFSYFHFLSHSLVH
jgi:hypothetical protein